MLLQTSKAPPHQGGRCAGASDEIQAAVRTRRGRNLGLILVWLAMSGWFGTSTYMVVKHLSSPVYAQDGGTAATAVPDAGKSAGAPTRDSNPAGRAGDASALLLLTSGSVIFLITTAVRVQLNRRTEDDA